MSNYKGPTEKEIESSILEWLRVQRVWCMKIQSGVVTSTYKGNQRYIHLAERGTPDILACIHGRFVGIEVKRSEKEIAAWRRVWERHEKDGFVPPHAERSVAQHRQQQKIRDAGGVTLIACSIQMLEEDLKKLNLIP